MTHFEDNLITVGQNVLSITLMAASFKWTSLLPPPDRIIEFVLGVLVGLSVVVFNIVRTWQSIKQKRKEHE